MSDQPTEIRRDVPRYKLTEKAYIDDRYYEVGEMVDFTGPPGWHMEPQNNAARAMKKQYPSNYADPILSMTAITGAGA